jgi:hypothetical protein
MQRVITRQIRYKTVSKNTLKLEGLEKTTRGWVNGSQSKFLSEIRPISQNQPNVPLFQLVQDCIAIEQLSALETGLGTAMET